ncbi:uncharacterized protein LOC141879731 isoform X1 [Acropora palmata]|uniref:uncharacterized protein LOC141879731 isoform X1 n=1 Tax=Acropora palmata TaxID=6131 RepID=UPI003DA10E4E
MIIFSPDLNRVEQATIAKLPNFRGAFLAVGDAYDDCEIALSMIRLTSKLNFTKTTSFNLVLFVNVDSVRMVKERMMGEGAVDTQTAHFYVKNSHQSRDRTGPYLKESLITFIIGHWSVSRQVTSRHLSASNLDNVISLDGSQMRFCQRKLFPGFLGYCKTTLGSEETLNTDCFLRTGLIEGYVEFLQVSFHTSKRR